MVWHAVSGEELVVFSAHEEPIRHAAWNGDGSRIVSSSKTGARVWDAVTGQELGHLSPRGPYGTAVTFAAWAGDDARIVTAGLGAASVWHLPVIDPSRERGVEPEELVVHTHSAPGAEIGAITHVSWASEGGRLLSLSTNNTAEIWDADNGEGLTLLIGHTDAVRHGAWSPDDALVATGSDDGTARVWEAASGLEVARLTGHRGGRQPRGMGSSWRPFGHGQCGRHRSGLGH
ncbi:MAG: WD40 repeat domain-containing protein [Chloroflexota bacterium]